MEEATPDHEAAPVVAGLSPAATRLADWLRDLARTAKTARLYQTTNSIVEEARDALARATDEHLEALGGFTLRITPEEILFEDELIVHPPRRGPARGETAQRLIAELPFVLYRDGVRELTILPGIPRRDVDALVDALAGAWSDRLRADDIVTALWQANPTHIRVESAPPEQTLYATAGSGMIEASDRGLGLGFGLPPQAGELHGDLGDRGGTVGLHRETGLEAIPLAIYLSPRRGYEYLAGGASEARERLMQAWQAEKREDWREQTVQLFDRIQAADPSAATTAVLARFAATGVGHAIDHARWNEAVDLLELARRLDAGDPPIHEFLTSMVAARSDRELGEGLDEASALELDTFFRLAIALEDAGVSLALGALAGSRRTRPRAAACAALACLCADKPDLLAPALDDRSTEVVCLVLSILGHIGGPAVGPLCAQVVQHVDGAVTCELARILPAIGEPSRTELTLELMDSKDSQTLLLTLRSASREKNRRVAERIARMIGRSGFDDRPEEERRTLIQTLADTGDARVVPFLEAQLTLGGWFARPSWRRSAAAHALGRMGLPEARAVLTRNLAHGPDSVRAACREVVRAEAA